MYRRHAEQIYRYLYCLTGDADLAEELTQETFAAALKSLSSYRGDAKASTWLCGIAKRLWYRELRHRKHLTEDAPDDRADGSPSPEEAVLGTLDKMALFRGIRRLSPNMRELLYLRLTGELSFGEIGELMGESETWARVNFYRAKQKLLTFGKEEEEWND